MFDNVLQTTSRIVYPDLAIRDKEVAPRESLMEAMLCLGLYITTAETSVAMLISMHSLERSSPPIQRGFGMVSPRY